MTSIAREKGLSTLPANDAALKVYLLETLGVRLPDVQVCENHSTPFRAFSDSYFARSGVSVWEASRGFGGKSFLLSLLGHCEGKLLGADITILGGSGEQAQRVIEYVQQLTTDTDNTKRQTFYPSGGRIRTLTASSRSVRGAHPQRLRCDEVDEMEIEILNAALGQPMSSAIISKQTTLSSTHQYPNGTMTDVKKRAKANGWAVHQWCYKETLQPHGWLTLAEVESKRGEVPEAMWLSEYELQEPSSADRAVLPEKITAMFNKTLGVFEGKQSQYIEIEPPVKGAKYSTGADWAKSKDWTIISTLRTDIRPARVVAWERRGRETYPLMIARHDDRIKRYGGTSHHDATGLGDVVDDYQSVGAIGVKLVGQVRADLFAQYIVAIENGSIESPFITYAEAEHRYCATGDLHGEGHPPDSFVAGALAWYGRGGGSLPEAQPKQPSRWVDNDWADKRSWRK